jgi:hypothetical protein
MKVCLKLSENTKTSQIIILKTQTHQITIWNNNNNNNNNSNNNNNKILSNFKYIITNMTSLLGLEWWFVKRRSFNYGYITPRSLHYFTKNLEVRIRVGCDVEVVLIRERNLTAKTITAK